MFCSQLPQDVVPLLKGLCDLPLTLWLKSTPSHVDRLAIIEVVLAVLDMNYDALDDVLLSFGIVDIIFDQFVQNPVENIPCSAVTRMVVEVIQNNHQRLRNFLISAKSLLHVIVEMFDNEFLRPHLTIIANCIVETSKVCKLLNRFIEESTEVAKFFTVVLPTINERNEVKNWKICDTGERTSLVDNREIWKRHPLELPVTIPTTKKLFRCVFCGQLSEENILCPRCGRVSYCSRECQKKHWKSAHSNMCTR
eukprot:TRINITY_DN6079_c0_g1_i3.p1 TRINITY_DN6079_c0_g1~~TRINITY_DN6079_c0_g1_i3.p1  ORF type:complete len:252 (-),score=20.41 TRINITY_DN6079_c0_g1_i3:197-952(-)